jgi:hypothetical protein
MLVEYVVAEPSLVVAPTSERIIKLTGRKTIKELVEDLPNTVTSQTSSTKQARDLRAGLCFLGGEGEIRTHGYLAASTVFETAAFDHSATSPYLTI